MLLAATAACRSAAPERWSLARAAVAVARSAGEAADTDDAWLLTELGHICERARPLLQHTEHDADALVRVLFDELGFAREVESTDLRFVLLPSVLRERRGSCVGLGLLYLALAEALGFEAYGVLLPGHLYVRQLGPGAPRNVELLRRGEAMSDSWYRERFAAPGGTADYYGTPLTTERVLGLVEYNVGNERRRQQRYAEAEAAYARAVHRFPSFAEAHASLGAMQHLLGKLVDAAASYRTAHQLNSSLRGLEVNRAMLAGELRRSE